MKKKWISVLLAAVMAVTAAGCGSTGGQGTDTAAKQEEATGKETAGTDGTSAADAGEEATGTSGEAVDESVKATLTYWEGSGKPE